MPTGPLRRPRTLPPEHSHRLSDQNPSPIQPQRVATAPPLRRHRSMVSVYRFQQSLVMPAWTGSSCSEGSNSRSDLHITRAFSQCMLDDVSQQALGALPIEPLGRPPTTRRQAKKLSIDLSSQPSQEFPLTQDFATPVEHHFLLAFDPTSSNGMDDSRSPAPSPTRQKRSRPVNLLDADSDCMSQDGISQSRSHGEPSSCSKATAAGPRSRPPPIPKGKRKHEPQRTERSPRHKPDDNGDPAPQHAPLVQTKIPQSRLYQDYAVEKEIGRGNSSIVYRAVHRQCGKAYAIKRSRRPLVSAAGTQEWLEEVKALAAVEGHPNIITYYDSWTEPTISGDYLLIKLELCGENLGSHVKAKQALPNSELWEITQQMASALKHLHDLGLVHMDLKPDNIYRTALGQFKLGDFGLAKPRDGSKGVSEGDSRYMATEVLKNKQLDSLDKADMFSLGATLYELASGCPLADRGERWQAVREGKLLMLPAVAHQLQSLIKKLLSPDPAARPDAAAVLALCSKHTRSRTAPSPSRSAT